MPDRYQVFKKWVMYVEGWEWLLRGGTAESFDFLWISFRIWGRCGWNHGGNHGGDDWRWLRLRTILLCKEIKCSFSRWTCTIAGSHRTWRWKQEISVDTELKGYIHNRKLKKAQWEVTEMITTESLVKEVKVVWWYRTGKMILADLTEKRLITEDQQSTQEH